MIVNLVFENWQKDGVSIHGTPEGIELYMGDFHAGSTFRVRMSITGPHCMAQEGELWAALEAGYTPVFSVYPVKDTS